MEKIYPGDYLTLTDGREVMVTDVPEGNEDAPEDLLVVTNLHTPPGDYFVIAPFQIDKVLAKGVQSK